MHDMSPPAMPGCKAAVGIRGIGYHFDETVPIETLPEIAADPILLASYKAHGHRQFARSHVSITEQAILSARKTLHNSGLTAADIDAVVIGTSELRDWKYFPERVSTEVLLGLGLKDILVVGVTLAGCANYGSALRVARNMIMVDGYRHVLVIESNQVRGGLQRVSATGSSAGYILGDGAVSFVATSDAGEFKVRGMGQIVKPLADKITDSAAFIANNISGFRHVVERALAQAGIAREQVEKVFLHNINWHVLAKLMSVIDFPVAKLYGRNIPRTAHLWGADNLIGLHDYCAESHPSAGALFLLVCQADTYFSAVVCEKQ